MTLVVTPDLAMQGRQAVREYELACSSAATAVEHALSCGAILLAVQSEVPTGKWGAWCKARGVLLADPAITVRAPRETKAKGAIGHRRWTAGEIEQFRARWPVGTTPRAVFELVGPMSSRQPLMAPSRSSTSAAS